MFRALRPRLAAAALTGLAIACGPTRPELDGPCQSSCDCTRTDAPVKCVGEWLCNADRICEYTCATNLCQGDVYTCPVGTDCNGTFCSARRALDCR